jgi:hypothetical protein
MARYGAGVLEQIQKLSRHDQVRIKGNFIQNSAPLIHLNIDSVELLSHWKDDFDLPPYQRSLTLPKEILAGTELVGKVHAISGTVVVKSASELLGLHRGDLIHLSYKAYQMGSGPIHLVSTNIHVLDSILAKHGKPLTVEGQLILYPKSPQISIDVYAVQEVGLTGVALDYTLVNFESPEIFQKIRDKLKVAWDNQAQAVVRARNKLSNPRVRIKAVGIGNVVDPNQANPQILLDGPDSIEILP